MTMPDRELRKEILKSFHTQFAENQRSNQQLFLKVIGFLGAVVFGFVYVYENHGYDLNKLSYATLVSELLLSFGAGAVTIISYSFRRDQYVNAKIRKESGAIGKNRIFPESYNPCTFITSKNCLSWMPDILALFYLIFPIFQIIIIYLYIDKASIIFRVGNCNKFLTVIILIIGASTLLTIILPAFYFTKLKKFCKTNN